MKTKNSILNFISSYFFYFLIVILEFIKLKMFINYMGEDVYSLNQLYLNIFTYLNLLEAGMGSALIYRLYKLLNEKKYDKINSLYSGTVHIFRSLALKIFIIGCIISLFLPLFLKDNSFSLVFLVITFVIYLTKSLIDYCFFVPRYIIIADSLSYKINPTIYIFRIFTVIVEMLTIYLTGNYIFVLIPSILFCCLQNYFVNKKIKKQYKWLEYKKTEKDLSVKKDVNDLLVHKIGKLVFSNTDIILLSTFVGSASVVVYTAYNYVIKYANDTINYIYQAMKDSIGKIIFSSNEEKTRNTISQIITIYSYLSIILVVVLYFSLNYFVSLWLGNNYIASNLTLILFLFVLYQRINEMVPQTLINVLGLFNQTKWVVVFSSILNVIISVVLIHFLGINGVLIGTLIALYGVEGWAYNLIIAKKLFNKFELSFWFKHHIKNIFLILFEILLINFIHTYFNFAVDNLFVWILYSFIIGIFVCGVTTLFMLILYPNFKEIIYRILNTLKSFVKKSKKI